jgi:hypothetical protein
MPGTTALSQNMMRDEKIRIPPDQNRFDPEILTLIIYEQS